MNFWGMVLAIVVANVITAGIAAAVGMIEDAWSGEGGEPSGGQRVTPPEGIAKPAPPPPPPKKY